MFKWFILFFVFMQAPSWVFSKDKFELSALKESENKKTSEKKTEKQESVGIEEIDQENPLAGKQPSEYYQLIKNLEFLYARSKAKAEKETNLFNLISVRLMLARVLILRGKNDIQKKVIREQLEYALNDSKNLIESNKGNAQKQALAHYFAGVVMIELDDEPKKILTHFNRALDLDPSSQYNPIMTLHIAEELFENEFYQKALDYYARFQDQMNPFQKSLAAFKSAWCHINLKNFAEAERLFMSIVLNKKEDGFKKDSVVNLAYAMTQHRDEESILKILQGLKPQLSEENFLDFLEKMHATILEEVSGVGGQKVLSILFQAQKNPIKRVGYLLIRVPYQSTLYASKKHLDSILMVFHEIEKNNLIVKDLPENIKIPLGNELEKLMVSYVETFAGRTKTPEPMSKKDISDRLKPIFTFYIKEFSQLKAYTSIVKIWLEICVEIKDHACTYQISKWIDQDQKLNHLAERGELERLVALEELIKSDPKKYQEEFAKRLELFAKNRPDSKIWPEITQKIIYNYQTEKNYSKSIYWLKVRYQKLKDPNDFYKLYESYYLSGQYEEAVQLKGHENFKTDPRLTPLLRESALQVAQKSLKANDLKKYDTHIQLFLSLNPDADKALIAEKNYLSQLWAMNRQEDVHKKILSFPLSKRLSPDFLPYIKNLSAYYSQNGDFIKALDIFTGTEKLNPDTFFYERFILELSTKKTLTEMDYVKLTPEQKEYVLSLYILSFPEQTYQFLSHKNNLTDFEKKLTLLSYQFTTKDMDSVIPRQLASVLGSIAPKEQVEFGETPTELQLKKVPFQEFQKFDKNVEKNIEVVLSEVRSSRKNMIQDLKGKPLKVQLRGFRLASETEKRVVNYLNKLPAPVGLSPEQVIEYQKGIKEMASEFSEQALLYDQSIREINLRLMDSEKSKTKAFLQPDMERWPWPQRKELMVPLSSAKNTFGSLLYLDFLKNENKITQMEYSILRTGLLLKMHPDNQAMRDYMVLELKSSKQDAVINRWERIQVQ